ncbi:6-phosphogluconolactonase [Woodsholea maritima]|uniref:6-phosphogluconolactonase n=1 Tax=Woodsholea maritima TaxID=240237 RepID=UPI000381A3A4|nr:6-phosphogluconolactonase [Woodsholea maritima]
MPLVFHTHPTRQARDVALCQVIETRLRSALAERGQACFIGAGGGTPRGVYDALSHCDLDWPRITLTTSDAICLPEALMDDFPHVMKTALHQNKAAHAPFTALYERGESADQAITRAQNALKPMMTGPVYTLLGMGTDGHIASLYPHALGLERALALDTDDLIAPLAPTNLNAQPFVRISFTYTALIASTALMILLDGPDKRAALDQFLNNDDLIAHPASAVLRQEQTPVEIYWSQV